MTAPALHNVAVVGGGPAGSTAAYLLARNGFRVSLFDRQCFPRTKLCAGLLTWKTVRLLEALFGKGPETLRQQGIIIQTCSDYKVYYRRTELAHGRLAYPFHLVDRPRYDHFWLEQAREAGAHLYLGTTVKRVEPNGRLSTHDGTHQFDAVIGADGVLSRVRRCMAESRSERRVWRANLAATIEVRRSAPIRNLCTLHFGYAPWGYAWSFPNQQKRVIGICGLDPKVTGPSLSTAFRQFLGDCGFDEASQVNWQAYPLPYGNFISKPARGRLLLIGDAAGLADPLLGEGIFYAHRSAQVAAEAVTVCRDAPAGLSARYVRLLNRLVLREFRWIVFYRMLLFFGGHLRRFRGLRLFLRLFPARLEALVQGTRPYSRLLFP